MGRKEASQQKLRILMYLEKQEKPQSHRQIGNHLNITSSIALSNLLKPLIEDNYIIEEIIMTNDGSKIRSRLIRLDVKGDQLLEITKNEINKTFLKFLGIY